MRRFSLVFVVTCFLAFIAEGCSEKLASEIELDLGGGAKMKLVLIPMGKFQMGSASGDSDEHPVHEVAISKSFYMGVTEVTQAQYQAVMGSNPSDSKEAQRPVENVSWNLAVRFCEKLSEKTRKKVRLPSEAAWEYACRAGSTTEFSFGDDVSLLGQYAWYKENSERRTHPVGLKKPNAWGLHDMHGNVYEWCLDHGHYDYSGAPDDGSAWTTGDADMRVLRGGSWLNSAKLCRAAHRPNDTLGDGAGYYGFRVVIRPSEGLKENE